MKKLSTIIALALVITIGGVYAAWHYNRGAVSLEFTRSATMASVQSDTSKGSIAIDQTANSNQGNTLKFLVDDTGEIDWVADLVPSGSVWVKFTPAQNADAIVQEKGIRMMATITVTGTKQVYTDPNTGKAITIFQEKTGENSFVINDVATKGSVEITAEQIANCLDFNVGLADNEVLKLDSYDENVNYEVAMKTYVITITITEAPAN